MYGLPKCRYTGPERPIRPSIQLFVQKLVGQILQLARHIPESLVLSSRRRVASRDQQ